ncbi:hypothetical protein ACH4U6_02645 [Streptomyces netropsis]|uniref:hypothetical protein n=1 Tax=Streptomyces netropsis TaxID=55404 RepID=UPI0037A50CCB
MHVEELTHDEERIGGALEYRAVQPQQLWKVTFRNFPDFLSGLDFPSLSNFSTFPDSGGITLAGDGRRGAARPPAAVVGQGIHRAPFVGRCHDY